MRLALLAVALVACKTSYEAESASHATVSDSIDQQGRTITETTSTSPIRIVTETTTASGVHRIRTVELAPVTSTTTSDVKSQERADSTLDEQHSEKRTFDFLHGPFALIGGIVLIGGAAFAAIKLLKPRLL